MSIMKKINRLESVWGRMLLHIEGWEGLSNVMIFELTLEWVSVWEDLENMVGYINTEGMAIAKVLG